VECVAARGAADHLGNLCYRNNIRVDCKAYADFKSQRGNCITE